MTGGQASDPLHPAGLLVFGKVLSSGKKRAGSNLQAPSEPVKLFRRRFDMSRFAFIPRVFRIPFRHALCSAMMVGLLCVAGTAQAATGWFTDPVSGCQVWWNAHDFKEARWSGACEKGKAQGEGRLTLTHNDGEWKSLYIGFFQQGFLNGKFTDARYKGGEVWGGEIHHTGYAVLGVAESYIFYQHPDSQRYDYYHDLDFQGYDYWGQDGEPLGGYTFHLNSPNRSAYLYFGVKNSKGKKLWRKVVLDKNSVTTEMPVPDSDEWEEHKFECAPQDACIRLFEQKLAEFGMADFPERWKKIAAKGEAEKAAAAVQARAEHAKFLTQGPPEKLFSHASRKEREGDYEGAMEALLAIVENFPKSDFTNMAMQRTGTLQDKLDAKKQQEQEAKRQAQEAEEQQRVAEERQERQERLFAEQKKQDYQICKNRYDSCMSECDSRLNDNLMSGISSALRGDRLGALQSQLTSLGHNCSACDAMGQECEAYR
jgi:hypothetical protein